MEASLVDDKSKPAVMDFRCPCGVAGSSEVGHRPGRIILECPNPACLRVWEIGYVGRRHEPELEQAPLRLVR